MQNKKQSKKKQKESLTQESQENQSLGMQLKICDSELEEKVEQLLQREQQYQKKIKEQEEKIAQLTKEIQQIQQKKSEKLVQFGVKLSQEIQNIQPQQQAINQTQRKPLIAKTFIKKGVGF